ncbi:MAG: hypothetical protein JWO92_1216 [Chitinophagaceae bacterium]|nr:hypothetical protein [Chitinophagaceae bacterium]
MEQNINFKYLNAQLNIGVVDLKNVYLISPTFQKLLREVYKGKLVFRIKGSSKRISYNRIKKNLVRKPFTLIILDPTYNQQGDYKLFIQNYFPLTLC